MCDGGYDAGRRERVQAMANLDLMGEKDDSGKCCDRLATNLARGQRADTMREQKRKFINYADARGLN